MFNSCKNCIIVMYHNINELKYMYIVKKNKEIILATKK